MSMTTAVDESSDWQVRFRETFWQAQRVGVFAAVVFTLLPLCVLALTGRLTQVPDASVFAAIVLGCALFHYVLWTFSLAAKAAANPDAEIDASPTGVWDMMRARRTA